MDVNEGRGGVGFRIGHIWAVLCVQNDGDEGVVAIYGPKGWTPLIAADKARLEDVTRHARRLAKEENITLRLVRFEIRSEVETFHPDGRRERATGNG